MKATTKASAPAKASASPKRRSDVVQSNIPDISFEIVSASVPKHVVLEVKRRVGKRGFSQYVTRSLEHELLRDNQLAFVAEAEVKTGLVSPEELAWAERLLSV